MKIIKVLGREIFDSRGWPTVACELILENGLRVHASVPSGISRGRHEACELRDGGKRLWGKGVLKAIENIEQVIAPLILNEEPNVVAMDLRMIDLDSTRDKSHLGSNAMLAVSMAICKAQALIENIELYELIAYLSYAEAVSLPFPQINLINGALHGDSSLAIQEFMVMPLGAQNFRASFEIGVAVFHELKQILQMHGKSTAIGDEGGFSTNFSSDEEALDYLTEALLRVESYYGNRCVIALDMAATQWYDQSSKTYVLHGTRYTSGDLVAWYADLIEKYPIFSIEDGLAEDDWEGWKVMTGTLAHKIQLVGDDLFVTNRERIIYGAEHESATGVIIKPNQVGTVTETLQAIHESKLREMNVIISHRSGETEESFIADLAVGTSAGQIKAGGCTRGERLAKYNRLLAIEDVLMNQMVS
jgi:enolase